MITKFSTEFERLRRNFDSGVNLGTALVLGCTEPIIDRIRHDQILLELKSVDMDEYKRNPCLPNTRSDVIGSITEWMVDGSKDQERVLWLYGSGSGHSNST